MCNAEEVMTLLMATIDGFIKKEEIFFDLNYSNKDGGPIHELVVELCYNNYTNWQYENMGRSSDDTIALAGYKGTIVNNAKRNDTLSKLDDIVDKIQDSNEDGVLMNTFACVLDMIIIMYIKKHYINVSGDSVKSKIINSQFNSLTLSFAKCMEEVFVFKSHKFLSLNKIKIYQ